MNGRLPWVLVVMILGGCRGEWGSDAQDRLTCVEQLRQIGEVLGMRRGEGRLRPLPGEDFLLQFADEVPSEDLCHFTCPVDPRHGASRLRKGPIACSYRGPDAATAASFIRGDCPADRVLACDVCGDDGTTRYHKRGLAVLRASGEARIVPWEALAEGEVLVGSSAATTWLRHLVR